MINNENINNPGNEPVNGKKISALRKKVSHLRFFVYVLVASLVLIASVSLLWIYSFYTESPFETYYSTPPPQPKAFLYLSPKEGNYKVGDEFSVNVLLNSAGSNAVGVAAYLSYAIKNMEVLSADVSDSIFEITFENKINTKDGKIRIAIAKPTPGVRVYNGKVATIKFKAVAPTSSSSISPYRENIYFDFTKGSSLYSAVIIDDKQGTTILDATRGAKINIEQ